MDAALKKYFGFAALRPYQKDVVDHALGGRDCLVVMATGGGKSLCYQLPPLITQKTAIVVSPLLSLMQDQVMSLNQKGITADYLGSSQTNPAVVTAAQTGHYNVLYMTPEKAMSLPRRFWETITKVGICLLAVDEAHCISEWGSDFRMEYKKLSSLRKLLPGVPFLALTATATSSVRDDIKQSLSLKDPFVYIGSFDRPNLYYGVKLLNGSGKIDTFLSEISDVVLERVSLKESTIIYCTRIRDTEQVHEGLNSIGIVSAIYNGKMDSKSRQKAHRSFITDEVLVMVATIAFGMGIDKPDVRCVIHYGCPKSLEGYYQESGRCGRDGLASRCLLYYSRSDFTRVDFYCSEATSEAQKQSITRSFLAGQKYCCLLTCRRQELLNYFGQPSPKRCGNCDNCMDNSSHHRDVSKEAALLMSCIHECGGRWGLNTFISVLRGSKAQKIVDNDLHVVGSHGKGKDHQPDWWKSLGYVLMAEGYIQENGNGGSRCISISSKGMQFLSLSSIRQEPLVVKIPQEMIEDEEDSSIVDENALNETPSPPLDISLSPEETTLYQMLLESRKRLANDNGAAPYAICSDQVLRLLAQRRPSSIDRLAELDGVNLNFINRFGPIIIHCIGDMAYHLDLDLDNLGSVEASSSEDDSLFNLDDLPEVDGAVTSAVVNAVASKHGVSYEEIALSLGHAYTDELPKAIDFLECTFEIYRRDGLYYTM